jgi:hypothetical protein
MDDRHVNNLSNVDMLLLGQLDNKQFNALIKLRQVGFEIFVEVILNGHGKFDNFGQEFWPNESESKLNDIIWL